MTSIFSTNINMFDERSHKVRSSLSSRSKQEHHSHLTFEFSRFLKLFIEKRDVMFFKLHTSHLWIFKILKSSFYFSTLKICFKILVNQANFQMLSLGPLPLTHFSKQITKPFQKTKNFPQNPSISK